MTTALDRAFDLITSDKDHSHSLEQLRLFAGIKMRSRYKLGQQLRSHPNVMELTNGRFQYCSKPRAGDPGPAGLQALFNR